MPVTIVEDKTARGQSVVTRVDDGDIMINRALVTIAPVAFREAVQSRFDGGIVDDTAAAYAEIQTAISGLADTVTLTPQR